MTSYESNSEEEEEHVSNGAASSIGGAARHPATGNFPDPAPTLRFLVTIPGLDEPIGRFAECSGIEVEYETLDWPEGGENTFVHKLRGRAKYKNLVLKRGLTNEQGMMKWFRQCADRTKRTTVTVELKAGDAASVRKFSFNDAFPVKWTGPNLAAGQNQAAVETLEIAHHGFAEA